MQEFDFDHGEMERIAYELVKFEEDPSTWGENTWDNEMDPLSIWKWAESQHRIDLMSGIAPSVAAQVMAAARYNPKDENYQRWISIFSRSAEEARAGSNTEILVRFLEALLSLNPLGYKDVEKIDEILSLYQQLHKSEKIVYYLDRKATALNSLLSTGGLKSGEEEIWKIGLEMYRIGKEVQFHKGIALALLRLGHYLSRKNKDKLALKFLYQARIFASKAGTKFGISATEALRKIRDRSGIPASSYEVEIEPDLLIDEFIREVAT